MQFESIAPTIAALRAWETPVSQSGDAVDLIGSARYETGCEALIFVGTDDPIGLPNLINISEGKRVT